MTYPASYKTDYTDGRAMTLASMRRLGLRELNVPCLNPACRHEKTFSTDDYADEIEVSWFRSCMICAKCGGKVDARPNWKERPAVEAPDEKSAIRLGG
jgi:hypothetical protein